MLNRQATQAEDEAAARRGAKKRRVRKKRKKKAKARRGRRQAELVAPMGPDWGRVERGVQLHYVMEAGNGTPRCCACVTRAAGLRHATLGCRLPRSPNP